MDLSEARIRGFLKLGYFLDATASHYPIDFSRIDRERYADVPEEELVRIGRKALRDSVSAGFTCQKTHVLPLSGGYDSRLILAELLEHTPARNIETYTYGVPHSYDYDIGAHIAKVAGTRHVPLPLGSFTYHFDDLLDFAARTRCQGAFLHCPPFWILDRLYAGATVWSGYVGDAVVGSHFHDPPSPTVAQAKCRYLANRAIVRSVNLHGCSDQEFLPYVSSGDINPDLLTWDEQVLFSEGVRKFTEPLVLVPGFDYRTPLINSPWMDLMLSVPNTLRLGQRLMLQMARAWFPRLFSLPSKATFGLPPSTPAARLRLRRHTDRLRKLLHQIQPKVSYPFLIANDFDEAFRSSPDWIEIARLSLSRLKKRGIVYWLDLDYLWASHQRRSRNLGDALMVLVCLEANLTSAAGTNVHSSP